MTAAAAPVAVLGLGHMGRAVSGRLLAAGHVVRGHDVSAGARKAALEAGVDVCNGLPAAVDNAAVVISYLPDAGVVGDIADAVLSAARPGTIWLEMSSSHPDTTRAIAERAGQKGVRFLDAPVAGGVAGAENGTLTIMAAGPAEHLAAVMPVLEVMGQKIIHVSGRAGDGDLAKVINNLLAAANLALAAEGLALGLAEGLDVEVLLDVLNASSATSFATRTQIPRFALTGRFDARFTTSQYSKDADVALDVARRRGLELPLAGRAGTLWRDLTAAHGSEDYTHIVEWVAETAGTAWPTPHRASTEADR
ncbi:NAD(P)-dependent oxidoreductase [Mangrovihabitans endophyticus]|uniref:Putative 3-hydroxyisobutyrate dehydrogenase n=1 Tax=Mangrovihabitans endophyticus TaxID=1751298 RepID=A0A8J3BY38_9ACTN|nr:NAD(P)-dependent oxidoreductase [Mangrovihabitans endophyticus]GGK82128.1 putative 3-hydroxyisobutyrate dehydrogenase [Mangrovihabitans endophyticus]